MFRLASGVYGSKPLQDGIDYELFRAFFLPNQYISMVLVNLYYILNLRGNSPGGAVDNLRERHDVVRGDV